ncbi:sodium-coupled monocarboxylate transporter 2-like [Contarinia nasturtii]|uniref:sodium-coupled monocarboxylate transporter 2-like n=1 Tax=Contarinia nasturtii TaxID=265458 RepID=UPI0012D471A9|nr:sodium-coupled monocarboxylate transporter 2-like [Contarinia nasturtii]
MNQTNSMNEAVSSFVQFTQIDYAIIFSLLSFSLLIGIVIGFFCNGGRTTEDFLFGSFKMKSLPVALSLIASQISPLVILTMPVEIYSYGWQYMLFIPTLFLVMFALCYIFLPILYQNKLDNCYTYLDLRFGPLARNINIVAFTINNFLYLPVIMYIPSCAFAELSQFDVHVVNVIVCYICVLYTALGGLKAIISIGCVHAIILTLSIVAIASLGVYHVGLDEIWSRSVVGGRIDTPDLSVNLTTRTTLWNLSISTFLVWVAHLAFSQNNIQRIVSLPTLQDARRTVVILFTGVAVMLFINCGIGLIMWAFYYHCDPVKAGILPNYDKLLPQFAQSIAVNIAGMPGLFVASLFCASFSVCAPMLHSLSGILYRDCIRPLNLFADNDANANLVMRILIFAIGSWCAMSSTLVETFHSAFHVLNAVTSMTTGAKVGVFTMGLFWPWTNINGLLTGTILSMCVVFSLIVNAQYHMATGELQHTIMPTSIDGCHSENLTRVQSFPEEILYGEADEEFGLHDISSHWYTLIGVICVWIPGVSISYLTGGRDLSNFNFQLVSPLIHRWIPKKCLHTKLKVISIVNDNDEKHTLTKRNTHIIQ